MNSQGANAESTLVEPTPASRTTKQLYWAGGLSIGASLVHGALTSAHFAEWWAYGAFFTLAAMTQGIYGFAILSSHVINGAPINERWPANTLRTFYAAGIAGNGILVLMYVASRTVGVLGEIEPWDGLGIFTKILELATMGVLALLLTSALRKPRPSP